MEEKLGFLDLMSESIKIPFKNPNFIILTFLTSLPSFFFSILHETFFLQTLTEAGKIIQASSSSIDEALGYGYDTLEAMEKLMGGQVPHKFLLLGLLYLGVLYFLDLFNTVAMVDIASRIYTEDKKEMKLADMFSRVIRQTRFKGPLITSTYVFLQDFVVSIGLISIFAYFNVFLSTSYLSFLSVFVLLFIALFMKYIEWVAVWSLGIVVSVLEEKQGDVALVISSYLSRERRRQGFVVMVTLFGLRFGLRLLCLYVGWNRGGSGVELIAISIALFTFANVLKCLIFVVYFYDCKKQSSLKAMDQERSDLTVT